VSSPIKMCIVIVSNTHQEPAVRTNIVIDDILMRETLKATGIKTKREAVELGLQTLLRLQKQAEIRRYRGKLAWRGDLDSMRRDR
jgi:Arc/MetJ family transcription regulator